MTYLIYNFKANPKYGTWEYHCKKHSRETKKVKYELDFTKINSFLPWTAWLGKQIKLLNFSASCDAFYFDNFAHDFGHDASLVKTPFSPYWI